jgi:UTP--glucose-1-phosphate uridylyltransferase
MLKSLYGRRYSKIQDLRAPLKAYIVHNFVSLFIVEEFQTLKEMALRYILTPDIFDTIRETPSGKNGELQITDALMNQAKKGMVLAYKFKGRRFDCGSVDGFVQATNFFYELEAVEGE